MIATSRSRILVAAVLAAATLPAAARAQQTAQQTAPTITLDTISVLALPVTRADTLSQKAAALLGNSAKKWRQAAYMYQIAASMRPLEDIRGIDELAMASHLLYAVNDVSAARSTMEHAASYAEERGEVAKAAFAYVDAGYLALEAGNRGRAEELGRKARMLSTSPFVSPDDRAVISRRVAGDGGRVALVTP